MPFTSSLGGGSTRSWGGIGAASSGIDFKFENLTYVEDVYSPFETYVLQGRDTASDIGRHAWGDDGKKLYFVTQTYSGSGATTVFRNYQYECSTPYEPSTATFTKFQAFQNVTGKTTLQWWWDGTKTWRRGYLQVNSIQIKDISGTAWDLDATQNFDQNTAANIFLGSSDFGLGYNLFNNMSSGGSIYYDVMAWDFFDDGNKVVAVSNVHGNMYSASTTSGDTVAIWTLSTPYDLTSTKTLVSSVDINDLYTIPNNGNFNGIRKAYILNGGRNIVLSTGDTQYGTLTLWSYKMAPHNINSLRYVSHLEFNTSHPSYTGFSTLSGSDSFVGGISNNASWSVTPDGKYFFHQLGCITGSVNDNRIEGSKLRRWAF